ncbi:vitellogenin fused with superoxide dismutase [Daphnia sinensis]|uniref:Vitellogenin fused with superoxide dismutase n=1 Tax=Daphnia sinensis TaxID=1820382 RepID=A0AAD5PZX9_9CRUS|nr:vitellogenin fused with superoxide dismutase [Daphnia sinensis]
MRLHTVFLVFALGCVAARSPHKPTEGPRRALVTMEGMDISGKLMMEQASISSPVKIRGVIYGLEPGRHGLHVHAGTTLGDQCDSVGGQFVPAEKYESERSVGYLGNIKTYTGVPSRTDVSLISSLVSLFEESPRSILGRAIVIHQLPDDRARASKNVELENRLIACGLLTLSQIEEPITIDRESITYGAEKAFKKIEQGILNGEQSWENVRHPHYGAVEGQKVPSNLNLEGVERPTNVDSLTLETAAPTRKVWMAGYTYEYDYAGWTSTGIMGISTKVSGGSIKGRLTIEPVDESTAVVALLATKGKQFNEDVMEKYSEVDPGQEVRIIDQEHLEKPFQVKFVSGKVETVAIGKEEPLWIVNFKRALAAQIQLQLDGVSGVFQQAEYDNYYAENTVYHAMEGSVTGECQTWYHISRLPVEVVEAEPKLLPAPELCQNFPVYEIVKNRDLDNCRILPIFNYNSNQGLRCNLVNGAGCENKISHSDTVRIIGCTSNEGHFIVQRIKSIDKLIVKPFSYETEATEGLTVQHLTLRSATPTGYSKLVSRISSDVHIYQTLAYSYDDDYKTHGPLMGKPTLRNVNSPMIMEVEPEILKKEALRLLSEIISDVESEAYYVDPATKYTSDKINMLRRALASLDYNELMAFVAQVWENKEWSTSNQIVVDALMLTGTNPSLMLVREYILQGKIVGEQAVQAISALVPTVETPTKELLASWMEFLKSEVVQSQRQLKITTALSLSRLVYQACVNTTHGLNMFPKLVMGEFCNPSDSIVASQLVPYLAEQAKIAKDAGERMAFLTALGNIGHEIIVPYVKPFITSCEPSSHYESEWYERNQRDLVSLSKKEMRKKWLEAKKTLNLKKYEQEQEDIVFARSESEDFEDEALCNLVRSKAIFALSNLAVEKKEIVGTLLMPIFFNKAEETEVRLAALTLLFVSNPPQAFWSRVALSTWYEPNDQISHFIYTTIASRVANKNPLNREEAVRAEAVIALMKPMFWTSHAALNYQKAGYSEKTRLGYVTETVNFPGFESFVPSHHYSSLSVAMGPWFTKLMEFSIDSKHAEKFIDRLVGKPGLRFKSNKDESSIISPELEKIHEELKIEARATGQPELYIYLNFLDNYQRFFTINPNTIFRMIEKQILQSGFRENAGKLEINFHKYLPLLDSFARIPSAMGLAYTWTSHHSVLVSLKSKIEGGFAMSSWSAKLEGALKPVVVSKMSTRLMVDTPFTRAFPTTGVDMEWAAALPGRFLVEGDIKTGKIQTTWETLGDKLRVVKHSVVPFTTIRKITDFTPAALLSETKRISYVEEPKENKVIFGEKHLGMNFVFVERGERLAVVQPSVYSKDWFGTLAFAAMPSTLRQREWSLYLDNASSETKAIKTIISISTKSDSKFETPLTGHLHAKSLFDTIYGEQIMSQEYVKQQDSQWESQKFQHIFQTLTNPTGYSLDFTAELVPKSSSIKARRIGSSVVYGMDGKSHRGSLMVERRDEVEGQNNFVLCAEVDAQFPDNLVFKRKELIKDETERRSTIKIGFGKSCTDDRKITVATTWTRSEEDISPSLRNQWEKTQCQKQETLGRGMSDECIAARRLSSILNKAVMTINYNEMPAAVRNATIKASNLVRHWLGPYMSDNQVEVMNTQNQITVESVYYPLAGSMDVKVFKPYSNVFFRGIEIHPIAEVILPKRMAVPRSVLAAPGVCLIGSETVTTFDGLFYNASFSGCDQLLTKDCSGRYKFAVLSRVEGDKKIVTVLLNKEKIEIFPAQQKVNVNGMEISVTGESYTVKNAENEVLAVIKKTADNFIEVDSPISHMIRVLTDAKEVVVLASPIHRGRLCGLCGSQNGDKVTDLTGPRQCAIPRDLMDVAYELRQPAGCKSDISSRDVAELRRIQEECLKEKSETIFGISDVTPLLPKFQQNILSSQTIRRPSQWTVYRNKMVVQDNKRCFSTESVPKCAEGARAQETVEKKLGFHCLPKNILSEKLNEEMSSRPLDELMGKQVDMVRVYSVPTTCLPF